MIGQAELEDGLYYMKQPEFPQHPQDLVFVNLSSINSVQCTAFDLWHFRLGHPSIKMLKQVSCTFPYVQFDGNKVCDYCHLAKQQKFPFPTINNKTLHPFDLIHADKWGPLAIASIHDHQYFLNIVYDYTRHTWLFLMKTKSEARTLLHNFISLVKTQFQTIVKVVRR